MRWNTIVNRRQLLSEAPPTAADEYQLTQEDLGEDNQDFETTEVPGADPASGQPADPSGQMDPGMDQQAAMGDGGAMGGDPMMNGDPMMGGDPMPPGENEIDRLKKLTLLEKYKQILEMIQQLKYSVECIEKIDEYRNDEQLEYAVDMTEKLENKINDVITYRFLTEDYKELLRIFYYVKYSLIHITKLISDITVKRKSIKNK